MSENQDSQNLSDLEKKIKAVMDSQPAPSSPQNQTENEQSNVSLGAARISFDLIAAILGCTLLGWLMDKYIGTGPFGLIGMILMGFVVGLYNVYRLISGTPRPGGAGRNLS
jgi:ATP synthase protein I